MQRLISTSDVGRPRACVRGVSGTRHVGLWLRCVLPARNDRLIGASSPHLPSTSGQALCLRRESETESESANFFTNLSETVRLPDFVNRNNAITNCQFCESAVARLGPVHFLSPDQQSGIHCLIICMIRLLTPNDLSSTCKRIRSLHIRSVSALEVFTLSCFTNRHLLTYLLTYKLQLSMVL